MKSSLGFLCLLLVSTALALNVDPKDALLEEANEVEMMPSEEIVHANFLKVLSAIFLRKTPVSMEVKQAVKSVMREFLNGQPRKQGYWTYLMDTMRGMMDRTTGDQMNKMLSVMEEMSPKESIMSKASATIRNWFQSDTGREFIQNVAIYIKNLFHKNRKFLPKVPDLQASVNQNNNEKPATLPAVIDDSENVARLQANNRVELGSRLTNLKKINDGNKVVVVVGGGNDERRPGYGLPSKPRFPGGGGDRNRYPPGDRERYPEGGHYPDDRPHNHPRPGGGGGNYPGNYPEDRPHNHPRPGLYPEDRPNRPGLYPEDRPNNHPRPGYPGDRPHHPPGRPGDYYPEDRPQEYPDRPHGKPSSVDKVCIERIPDGNYRPRSSRLLRSK